MKKLLTMSLLILMTTGCAYHTGSKGYNQEKADTLALATATVDDVRDALGDPIMDWRTTGDKMREHFESEMHTVLPNHVFDSHAKHILWKYEVETTHSARGALVTAGALTANPLLMLGGLLAGGFSKTEVITRYYLFNEDGVLLRVYDDNLEVVK